MLIATKHNVYRLASDTFDQVYENGSIRAISTAGLTAAIVSGDGLTILDDAGERTFELTDPALVEAVDILANGSVLIGTEGPHIDRLTEDDVSRLTSFDELDARDGFYTPWGGPAAVRSFAHTPDGWVYADIHVGSIMRSADGGDSWEPVTPDLHDDVHQVATHAASPDTIYANTADAIYVSENRGDSWEHRPEGLPYSYGRAIAVHPGDPDCLLASVSRGPHNNVDGQLYRSDDRGRNWTHVTTGYLESHTENIDTFQVAFSQDGRAWSAIDSDLYVSEDRGKSWQIYWTTEESIALIAT